MKQQQIWPENRVARRFMYVWVVVVVGLALLTVGVYVGEGYIKEKQARVRSEELTYRPEVQQTIRQALRQGMREDEIKDQLRRYGEQEGTLIVRNMQRSARRALVVAVIVGGVLYWLVTRRSTRSERTVLLGVITGLLIMDLVSVAWKYIMEEDTRQTLDTPEVFKFLKEEREPYRVALLTVQHPLYNVWVSGLLGKHEIEHINVAADSRPSPDVQLFFYSDALSPLRRWQYCNVKYVIGPRGAMEGALRQLGVRDLFIPKYTWRERDGDHVVYALTNTLERVYAVGSWIIETNAGAAVRFMDASTNEPGRVAVVHEEGMKARETPSFESEVRIVSYRPERVEARVKMSGAGMVIMATAPDAGWRATVDGQPARIVRCNLLHQGVEVPKGEHTVVFLYDTRHWSHAVNDWAYRALPILLVGTMGWIGWKNWRGER
ncbi:MAG: hypothetical protein N2595_08090 [bacterium]|nr:hypothetical protein [bacterium]